MDTERDTSIVAVERRTWADDDLVISDTERQLTEDGELTAGASDTGAMIALRPSAADAERLAVDGGEEVEELHLTLGFLGEAAMIPVEVRDALVGCVAECVEDWPTIIGNAFNVSLMNPTGENPCVVLGVGGGQLERAHSRIMTDVMRTLSDAGVPLEPQHQPWLPHVTLVYTDEADLEAFTDRMGPITFDRVCLAFGGEVMEIPLGGDDGDEYEEDAEGYEDDGADSYAAAESSDEVTVASALCLDCAGDLEVGDRVQLTHLGETAFATVFLAEDGFYELLLDDAADLNDRVWYPGDALVPIGLTLDIELGDGFVTFARSQTVTRSDRNLKIYWTRGEGAVKIRWNTDGDFTRCVRHLRKYVRDPKGLCAVYHHMATGKWPHPHPGRPTE